MSKLKTNVSIKFKSIKEYREIEKKLVELGYKDDKKWNKTMLSISEKSVVEDYFILLSDELDYIILNHTIGSNKTYNSLQEFLKDK